MKKEDCYYFGYITKPIGYDGTFAVKADTDNLSRYNSLKSLFIDLNGTLTPFFIELSQPRNKEVIWLKADGFNSVDDIQNLIGKEVYLPLNMLPELKGNKFYYHEIVGFTVVDETHGDIGIIKDVIELPHQTILQVMQAYTEILIPLNENTLKELSRENKTLFVTTHEGLIEIYLNKNTSDEEME